MGRGLRAAVMAVAMVACASRPALPPAGPPVTAEAPARVYGARWCRHTRAALAWFRARQVPVRFMDVERDPEAMEEMGQRASAAGIGGRGIPLVEVRGRVLQGFDAAWIERALED